MTDKKQPEALRLADSIDQAACIDYYVEFQTALRNSAAELRRQHAENETLRAGYDAARLEIEPLLGPVDLDTIHNTDFGEGQPYLHPLIGRVSDGHGDSCGAPSIDWVIVGGESGPGARPMHQEWARSLRDQCQAAGAPFLFKQWGEWTPGENVERHHGTVATAKWFNSDWSLHEEDLASHDGHIDDEPDLYRVGKKAAGRLLDGREWNGAPAC